MTREKFKELIEYPTPTRAEDFWEGIKIRSVIARTLRLALQYPELAKEYYDSLPKAVCENTSATSNKQPENGPINVEDNIPCTNYRNNDAGWTCRIYAVRCDGISCKENCDWYKKS